MSSCSLAASFQSIPFNLCSTLDLRDISFLLFRPLHCIFIMSCKHTRNIASSITQAYSSFSYISPFRSVEYFLTRFQSIMVMDGNMWHYLVCRSTQPWLLECACSGFEPCFSPPHVRKISFNCHFDWRSTWLHWVQYEGMHRFSIPCYSKVLSMYRFKTEYSGPYSYHF